MVAEEIGVYLFVTSLHAGQPDTAGCWGGRGMFGAFQRWLSKLISEVPEEISACEFDCRNTECRLGNWSQCERRQQAMSRTCEKWLRSPMNGLTCRQFTRSFNRS